MPLDYSGQNLRGRSFKGQKLIGANFSGADIRGANFTNTNLKDADFSYSIAGLQNNQKNNFVLICCFISVLAGIITGANSYLTYAIRLSDNSFQASIWIDVISLLALLFFFRIAIKQSLTNALGLFTTTIIVATLFYALPTLISSFNNIIFVKEITSAISFSFSAIFIVLVISFTIIAGIILMIFTFSLILVFSKNKSDILFIIGIFTITSIFTSITISINVHSNTRQEWIINIIFSMIRGILFVVISIKLSNYFSTHILCTNEKDKWIRLFIINLTTIGSTSFYSANLTNADFTKAILQNSDLKQANLTRTRFYKAQKLNLASVGNSILSKQSVLNLLVSCKGCGQNYIGANLKGANLINADLTNANLKEANICEATFKDAYLEYTNLSFTQAIKTDFINAQMTGSCIEAWNIDSTTKLNNVDCRFIYLLENPKPGTDDREHRPSSGEFKPKEFTKLFEKVFNTVDLIFSDGIDWKAFVTAFKKVQVKNEDTELAIQSIENKGDGVVVVKVAVPTNSNKEKIHNDFTQNYQVALLAVEEKYKALLEAKDEQIKEHRQKYTDMKEITSLLASKSINVQVEAKAESKSMTNSNDSSRKIEIGSVGRDFNASGQALNLGDISGTVTNTISELPASRESEKPGIKELLKQLQTAIEAEENLTPKNKEKALKQVKVLAEASQNPNDEEKQDLADTAITMLKGLISSLPTVTTLVETCSNLLPMISKFIGID